MFVLGIESTCDETGCSIVKNGKEILSNVVSTQIDLHREYGGVVPELACRRHIDVIIPVLDEAIKTAGIALNEIDLIAVANTPGLIGALLIGLNTAKTLSLALDKPLIGVNHVEAHLYAAIMSCDQPIQFPCIGVVLSGGHSAILLIRSVGDYLVIGQTQDDAIGEAFDKTAKIMGLPYPGGPEIEQLAKTGNSKAYFFSAGRVKGQPYAFSFSGLKTAVLYAVRGQNLQGSIENVRLQDIAASFQKAAFDDIIGKVIKAAEEHGCRTVIFGGGVTSNCTLRDSFSEANRELEYIWPGSGLVLDNAAMIAGLGYHQFISKGGDTLSLEANPQSLF